MLREERESKAPVASHSTSGLSNNDKSAKSGGTTSFVSSNETLSQGNEDSKQRPLTYTEMFQGVDDRVDEDERMHEVLLGES